MKSRVLVALAALAVAATAFAGDDAKKADKAAMMEMMKAEMMKCAVCKNMMTGMDQYGPAMSTEVVTLDNGMAMVHNISDPAKVEVFHAAGNATAKAGMACLTMTDEQARAQLCEFCQATRELGKHGASISYGQTKMGDMMIISSNDPKVVGQIGELRSKCAMMASQM